MIKKEFFLLLIILYGAFYVRLYQFTRPVADWHSWRQVDTSSVSREFLKQGFDILNPKFHDLSKNVSLRDNPQGYRYVEFPIYNILQAGLSSLFNYFTLEEWGRLVTIFSQLISIVFLYLLVSKYTNIRAALLASAFFAFTPYNIFWGRTILPDSTTVTAILGSIYFFVLWTEKTHNFWYFSLTTFFTMLAFLLKPYALFFMLPHLYLGVKKFGAKIFLSWQVILFVIFSLAPFIFWRIWMTQHPEGIPQSNWLFNGDGIRFKGAFFHWLFADRISRQILGYFGLPFVILGIITKVKKEGLLYYSLLVSCLVYMSVIAKGNVQHDYYQILIIPTLAIFFGKGIDTIFTELKTTFNWFSSLLTISVCIVFMLAFSWYIIRDFYNLQHVEVVDAGQEIDKILPKDAKVIAPYGGDTTFLYYVNRIGWPVYDRPIEEFRKAGASFMVFVNPREDELNNEKNYKKIAQTKDYIIFDINKKPQQ